MSKGSKRERGEGSLESAERPSESTVERFAEAIEKTRPEGGDILVVAGPALFHSGTREELARVVREGYVDMLSAGNGFAVHDIERDLYGGSLGVDTESVDDGVLESGVMDECERADAPSVIAGSIRDDGPIPGTISDAVAAQVAIREQAHAVDLALMLSTILHAVAVGNCLPSTTRTLPVDIDPATVTQLLDRGSARAFGMATDVGTVVPRLADHLRDER